MEDEHEFLMPEVCDEDFSPYKMKILEINSSKFS